MQIPILQGIFTDAAGVDFRSTYPRNMLAVPKAQGISEGYLRPADGVTSTGTGPGVTRGGINWRGDLYRVMGTRLVRVTSAGGVVDIGEVGGSEAVSMDYSFDRLAIASGGRLYYFNGSVMSQVTDPDLGQAFDVLWIAGYFMTTDGDSLVVTELTDPSQVNPLRYGSSEADPDPVQAIRKLRNEVYAFNRYTVEGFQLVGGAGFPFQRIDGAQVPRGAIGRRAVCPFVESFAFVGSGKNEPPAVWLMGPGTAERISTREVETILRGYTEAELSGVVVEAREDRSHQMLLVHLPDRTLMYDANASKTLQNRVWVQLDSGSGQVPQTYRARHLVWAYDAWHVGDLTSGALGRYTDDTADHFGQRVAWEFGVPIVYNESRGALLHELELVALTGRAPAGASPVVWTSYSHDGDKWSQEKPVRAGVSGDTRRRLCWRQQGQIRHWRVQRFRGLSDARLTVAAVRVEVEALFGAANG